MDRETQKRFKLRHFHVSKMTGQSAILEMDYWTEDDNKKLGITGSYGVMFETGEEGESPISVANKFREMADIIQKWWDEYGVAA